MTAAQQLNAIRDILNGVEAPTVREYDAECILTTVDRVKWLADAYRDAKKELDDIADDEAGEDL